jgi:hypothetical protein
MTEDEKKKFVKQIDFEKDPRLPPNRFKEYVLILLIVIAACVVTLTAFTLFMK